MQQNDSVMVSIWCITYNHARFIRNTLDGFLSQKVNFRYKVVLYDDASTDGTSDIVKEYAQKYPDLFDVYISERNTFRDPNRKNFMLEYRRKHFTGKYVASCEGDDCWIDPYKLQKQIDYLETHPECSMCLHNALWIDYADDRIYSYTLYNCSDNGKILDPDEIICPQNAHPPTASFVVRRDVFDCDDLFFMSSVGDYPLMLAAFTRGYIFYDSRIMSVYRWMTSGSFNAIQKRDNSLNTYFGLGLIGFLEDYGKITDGKYADIIQRKIYSLMISFIENKDKNMTLKDSIQQCISSGYELPIIEKKLLDKIDLLDMMINTNNYFPNELRNYIVNSNQLYIMGAGKYSKLLAEKILDNGLNFSGFAVSDTQNNPLSILGKKVYSLSEISCASDVLIGILPIKKDAIEESLFNYKIKNYKYAYPL